MSQIEVNDKQMLFTDSTVKSSFFLKRLRRRSKTYSGEELTVQLSKKLFDQNTTTKNSESGLKSLIAKQSR